MLRSDILTKSNFPPKSAKLQLAVRVIDLPDEATGIRKPADDLRTHSHNDEAANFILRTISPACDEQDHQVIASIAGGRKTMGALLYAAMSLVGKESDRVTHVLVSEPYETCKGFFYPAQPVQQLTATPFGKPPVPVLAQDAAVEMADIRFVPLRNKFTELAEPRRTFDGLVECYTRSAPRISSGPPAVSFDLTTETLSVNGRQIPLSGRESAIVAFLLHRAKKGLPLIPTQPVAANLLNQFLPTWKRQYISLPHVANIKDELDPGDIARTFDSLRKELAAKGLADAIRFLCPKRGRIGFELRAE